MRNRLPTIAALAFGLPGFEQEVHRRAMTGRLAALASVVLLLAFTGVAAQDSDNDGDDAFLPNPVRNVSTVPVNGDVNPYGVVFVEPDFQTGAGPLQAGDILVSNFNNSLNLQGTGTTIVRIPATGTPTTFFVGPAGLGLSTALGTLRAGFVIVGNCPTTDGTAATAGPGSLLVINNQGHLIQTFTGDLIQGPWDMALVDRGSTAIAFVTNALTGTVSRLKFNVGAESITLQDARPIASGYVHHGDPVTLFTAPTGLVYDAVSDVLYVASSGDNVVYSVSNAIERTSDGGKGSIVYADNVHLHGPLGLARAPNGHLLVSNNDAVNPDPNQVSEIVEFTTDGKFVSELSIDPGAGAAFGMAVSTTDDVATLAAVDDSTSSIIIWQLSLPSVPVNLDQHGLTGSWFNPATGGQGIEMEVYPDIFGFGEGLLFGGWFTFDVTAAGGQRWYTLSGNVSRSEPTAQLVIGEVDGGNFNAPPALGASAVGNATLQFGDCNEGALSYTFTDGSGRSGTIPLSRLTANVTCSPAGDNGTPPTDYLLSGNWFDPSTSGQGLVFDINPIQSLLFAAWYTFAPDGQQIGGPSSERWYTLQGSFVDGTTQMNGIAIGETTGGVFNDPAFVTTVQVGTADITFQSCNAMTLAYTFTSGTNIGKSGTINLIRVGPTPSGCSL
jgi:hypothetical protein